MKKTTIYPLGLAIIFILVSAMKLLSQPCNPPVFLPVSGITEHSATLNWATANTPPVDHCWTIEIGGFGFACGQGEQVIETTVCEGDPGLTISGANISYTITGLQPGTSYEFSLVETCDGGAPNHSGPCQKSPFVFTTQDAPFSLSTVAVVSPDCPEVSPGYLPEGSFTINIADGVSCTGTTYDIAISPVANSSPLSNTPPPVNPPSMNGVMAGNFSFTGAGAGQYTVTVTETGPCNPPVNPVQLTVTVPDGADAEAPIWYITDVLGNIVADNDPFTAPGPDADLGTITLPEGECGYQQQLYAFGVDLCDGLILASNAVSATVQTLPATITPATQVNIIPDQTGNYLIDLHWSIGQTTLSAMMSDAAGNEATLTVSAFVDDNINPSVTIVGANNITIPACATTKDIIVTVYVDDLCDAFLSGNLQVTFNGTEQLNFANPFDFGAYMEFVVTVTAADDGSVWSATYTDVFGNPGSADVQLSVVQAAEDLDPVIDVPGNLIYHVPACDDELLAILSLQVFDDCDDIIPNQLVFDDGGSGIGDNVFINVDNDNHSAYFEYNGEVIPGTYLMTATYQGTTIDFLVTVTQDSPQAPAVILPGNLNFTLPLCQQELQTTFAVQIQDECDSPIDPASAFFSLGGQSLTPSYIEAGSGYFEFTETFTAANNGDLLLASYTDSDGLTTAVDALLTITEQADNWAPIIIYPANDLLAELDPCEEGPALVAFEVTATDNCDGDLTPTVTINPQAGVDDAIILPSPGGDTYLVAVFPGTYQVLIEATDAAGNTRQENFVIQVEQDPAPVTNLVCNSQVNVTLNNGCQAELIPDQLLDGEFGCLTDEDFDIVVVDGNPANGAVVDGCGDFAYQISLATQLGMIQGFNGLFAPSNWTILELDPLNHDDVVITQDEALLTSSGGGVSMAITIPENGSVSFHYSHEVGLDPLPKIYLINTNQDLVLDIDTGNGSETLDIDVWAGWILMLQLDGNAGPDNDQTVTFEIDNFIFEAHQPSVGNFTTCTGIIHADDLTPPDISCPLDTDEAMVEMQVQTFDGALSASDPTINLANYSCFLDFFIPEEGLHYYDLQAFTVTEEDIYTFELTTEWGDGAMALFQGPFNPLDPCQNIIGQTDDAPLANGFFSSQDPVYRVSIPMLPGETYTLMTTSWPALQTGVYSWAVYSDGNGAIDTAPGIAGVTPPVLSEMVTFDLICNDLDRILIDNLPGNIPHCYTVNAAGDLVLPSGSAQQQLVLQLLEVLSYTGYPNADPLTSKGGSATDNCGNMEICVEDEVMINGDCGSTVIMRTFTARDKVGANCTSPPLAVSCGQKITVRKPTIDDVNFVPLTAYLECDQEIGFDDGVPSPDLLGYPFIRTAFGIFDINQVYCNISAAFADGPVVQACEGSFSVVRTWTIQDDCDPSALMVLPQAINVGDFSPPEVSCPEVDYDFDGIADLITYSTGPFDCTAAFEAPLPTVTDNCSGWEVLTEIVTDVEVNVVNEFGVVTGTEIVPQLIASIPAGASRFIAGIPKGAHRFRYIVSDDCGNETLIECDFQVLDQTNPIAVCDDNLHISIGGNGLSRVFAEDVDEGSSDNCGPVRLEVRRLITTDPSSCELITPYYSDWGPYVDFDCCDIGNMVTIELRVWDDANMNGLFGGWHGDGPDPDDNSNTCMLVVEIEDNIAAFCTAPPPVTVGCDDLPYDFDPNDLDELNELFGMPSGIDNCPGVTTQELSPVVSLHDCGFGTIIRRFRAIDQQGNTSNNICQQLITINEVHHYEIKFPGDAAANCGIPAPDTIEINELGCDLLAVSVEDQFFSASGTECYKIRRTFAVINWCEYDGVSDPVIINRDEDCDGNPGDEDVWLLVRPDGSVYYDRDNNENNNNPLAFTKGTPCDGITNPPGHWISTATDQNASPPRNISSVGFWQYTQFIKVYDDTDPIITANDPEPFCSQNNAGCDGEVEIPFTINENCTPDDLTVKVFLFAFNQPVPTTPANDIAGEVLSGEYPDFTLSGTYPIGAHTFEVHVKDGCGNVNSLEIPFEVVDCTPPAAVCNNGFLAELMPLPPGMDADGDGDVDAGAVSLSADDFIFQLFNDCSMPLQVSVNRDGEQPDIGNDQIVFTCDDAGETVVLEVYVWDSAFNPYAVQPDGSVGGPNYDFCETFVTLQDNLGTCPQGLSVTTSGAIYTESTAMVEGVSVSLSGQMSQMVITSSSGLFDFQDLETGYDYSITPQLDAHPLNGVSTFDLVLITKHILGTQSLSSPYKMIAADANNSESITTLDVIQLRKLILNLTTQMPNNTSWRFVDAAYTFPNALNPWEEPFPEIISINDLQGGLSDQNFVAVKIGDVNGNAQTSNLGGIEERSYGAFELRTPDQVVNAANSVVVPFTASDLDLIQGFQATLSFDPEALRFLDIRYGLAREENFGLQLAPEGVITISWNENYQSSEGEEEAILFSLVLQAQSTAVLSDLLEVNSRYTPAEAYDRMDNLLDLTLAFETTDQPAVELFQNRPNPFRESTIIEFYLPEAAPAVLKIQDVKGNTLKTYRGDFPQGYSQIKVESIHFPQGILYYTLETEAYRTTRKMVRIGE